MVGSQGRHSIQKHDDWQDLNSALFEKKNKGRKINFSWFSKGIFLTKKVLPLNIKLSYKG